MDDESVRLSYAVVFHAGSELLVTGPGLILNLLDNRFFAERKRINVAAGIRKQLMKFVLDEDDVIFMASSGQSC